MGGSETTVLSIAGKSISDGGAVVNIPLPLGARVRHVSISPVTDGTALTTVQADLLDQNDQFVGGLMSQQQASRASFADGLFRTRSAVWHGDLQLDRDIEFTLRVIIYNYTAATKLWDIFVYMEVESLA